MRILGALLLLLCILGSFVSAVLQDNGGTDRKDQDVKISTDTSKEESNDTDENVLDLKEPTLENNIGVGEDQQKRFGYVLGNGFSFGKRFGNVLGHGMALGKRYGLVLGKGFSFGKRFGSVLGHGMTFGKRYGSLLGKGFAFGKRAQEFDEQDDSNNYNGAFQNTYNEETSAKRDNDESFDEDMEFVDLSGPVDEKKWVLNNIYSDFGNYKRSKREIRTKRNSPYFGNGLEQGDEMVESDNVPAIENDIPEGEIEKRFLYGLKGRGYISGKRQYNSRRAFGNVLGRGFSFGKRGIESDDDDADIDNTSDENGYLAQQKRYFHSSPGHRFLFGKRGMENRDKRFGYVLGRGFSFGKKRGADQRKRLGYVLGRGFSFGKRSSDLPTVDGYDFEDDQQLDKRAGLVLGKGFMFGKRNNKRFGWILGNGYSFGKRGDVDPLFQEQVPEVSQFIDKNGNIFVRTDLIEDFGRMFLKYIQYQKQKVFACNGQLIPHHADLQTEIQSSYEDNVESDVSPVHEVNFFIDDKGRVFVNANDVSSDEDPIIAEDEDIVYYTCDGQMTELLGDNDSFGDISKRGWGSVLGRGFRFGKRFGSRKRFGHILGSGFSFGK